jgi:hypothetical protein
VDAVPKRETLIGNSTNPNGVPTSSPTEATEYKQESHRR